MSHFEIPVEIFSLPPAERIEIVGKIWDSLCDTTDVHLSDNQIRVLKERLAEYRHDKVTAQTWEVVKKELTDRP